MPKLKKTRSRQEQQALLKSIENPKTPADILAASQNPHSPLNRALFNNLIAGVDFQLALEKAINTLNEIAATEDAKQKEAILRHEYQGEELEKMKQLQQVQTEQALRIHKQAIQQADLDHLRALLSAKINLLQKDKVDLASISDRIGTLDKEKNHLSTKWNDMTEKKHEAYKNLIQETGLRDIKGNLINDEARINAFAKMASGADGPSFVDIMQKVCDSQAKYEAALENARKERTPGFLSAPPPPPPPPFFPSVQNDKDMNVMKDRYNLMNQIKAFGNESNHHAKDEFANTAKTMLGLVKANHALMQKIHRADPGGQPPQLFREIAANRDEASKLTEKESALKEKIGLSEAIINVEKQQYRYLGGKEKDLNVQSDQKQELKQEKGPSSNARR